MKYPFSFDVNGILSPNEPSSHAPAKSAVAECVRWFKENVRPHGAINHSRSSYGWQLLIERETGRRVPNGAVIAAAMEVGYAIEPRALNAFFGAALKGEELAS